MNSHVHNQRCSLREGLSAFVAFIRLLSGVDVLMLYQVLFLAESRSTFITLKGFLTNMNLLMLSKI